MSNGRPAKESAETEATQTDETSNLVGALLSESDFIFSQLSSMTPQKMTESEYSALKEQFGGTSHGISFTNESANALLSAMNIKLAAAQYHPDLDPAIKLVAEADDIFKQIHEITNMSVEDYYAVADGYKKGEAWTVASATAFRDAMQAFLSSVSIKKTDDSHVDDSHVDEKPVEVDPEAIKLVAEADELFKQINKITLLTESDYYAMADDCKKGGQWTIESAGNLRDRMKNILLNVVPETPKLEPKLDDHLEVKDYTPAITKILSDTDLVKKKLNDLISSGDMKTPITDTEYFDIADSIKGKDNKWTIDTATKFLNTMQKKLDDFQYSSDFDIGQEGDDVVTTVLGNKLKVPMIVVGGTVAAILLYFMLRSKPSVIVHHH